METENYNHFSNYAAVIRDMIRHENDLTNHRLTWMFVLQGILLTAAASFAKLHGIPFFVISLLGIISTGSMSYSLWRSRESRRYLRELWRKRVTEHPALEQTVPPVSGSIPSTIHFPFLNPWILVPLIIVISWVAIICWGLACGIPIKG